MSKFRDATDYLGDGTYQLLPFRFERLSRDDIVLTNMAGEFVRLSQSKLEALIEHRLSHKDEIYPVLRAGHFLKEEGDRAAEDLLALKVRTRFDRLPNFTNLHLFVVTLRCDHACQYCQVSRQSEDKAAFDMTREIADKGLDLVFHSPNPAIKIEFQGGEPFLNFELVRYIVEQAEIRNEIQKRHLQFVVTTTLSLVTDEILEFCRDHKIYLSSSLDGPEDLHNRNRPRRNKNSHARFVGGLQRARDIVGRDAVSALMTTSPASMSRVKEIIDEYLRLGFDGIFLRHLSPYGFARKTKSFQAYNVEQWLSFYREGMDYIIELNKQGIPFVEHFSAILLTKMLTSEAPGFVDLMNPAGIGIAAIVVNYDGDVYASDESRMLKEMGDSTFCLGNVIQNSYEEIFTADILLNTLEDSFTLSIPGCSDCAFEPWCGSDPVYHHAMYGDILGRKPESDFCKRIKGIVRYLLDALQDDEIRSILTRWATRC